MATPHPTRVVRFTLLATLLGISLPFAIQALVECWIKPETSCNKTALLIATIAFILTALNFFHGKVVTLEDEDYNRALIDRHGLALADYILNLLVVLCFVFMAFFLGKPLALIITNLIIRVLDSILVIMVHSVSLEKTVRKAQIFWLRFNLASIVYWIGWLLYLHTIDTHNKEVSIAFLALILLDILLDYLINHEMYFSVASNWGQIAGFWDAAQGEKGDLFHRAIIVPSITSEMGDIEGKRILDVGCGNGSVARTLAAQGASVVGVDKYEAMLGFARSYAAPGATYQQVDIEVTDQPVMGGEFDYVVSCFTLQDCQNIRGPLRFIANNLSRKGVALIVFENDFSFENLSEHTSSRRRWVDPPRLAGKGRRQAIFWEPWYIQLAQCMADKIHHSEVVAEQYHSFTTITRHWSESAYLEEANAAGLEQHSFPKDLTPIDDPQWRESRQLRLYRIAPRIRLLMLRPKAADKAPVKH